MLFLFSVLMLGQSAFAAKHDTNEMVMIEETGIQSLDDLFGPVHKLQIELREARDGLEAANASVRDTIGIQEGDDAKEKVRAFAKDKGLSVKMEKKLVGPEGKQKEVKVPVISSTGGGAEVKVVVSALEHAVGDATGAVKTCATIPAQVTGLLPKMLKLPVQLPGILKKEISDKEQRKVVGARTKRNIKAVTSLPKLAVQTLDQARQLLALLGAMA